MKKPELIEIIKEKVQDKGCFEFSNIDGCKVKCSDCQLKVRFDGCANKYFGVDGGCDCIVIWRSKIALIECKTGKFGSSDAKKASVQIKKCYEFVKNENIKDNIEAIIFYENIEYTSRSRVKIDLKILKIPIKFYKCGVELSE